MRLADLVDDSAVSAGKKVSKGKAGTLLRQLSQGATLGAGDEAMDAVAAAVASKATGIPFEDLYREARGASTEELAGDWKDHPVLSLGSNLAGGIALGATGPAKAAFDWAGRGNLMGALLKSTGLNAGLGGAAGYASGEGDSRDDNAALGAAIGGVVGPVGVAISRAIGPAKQPIQKAGNKTVKKFSKSKAEQFFAEQLAYRPDLQDALKNAETLDDAAATYGVSLTVPEKLAFGGTDPLLAQQGVVGGNPQTGGKMAQFYKNRSGQIGNAYEQLVSKLHPAQTYDEAADAVISSAGSARDQITKKLMEQAGPLYDEAFSSNPSVSSKLIDKILDTPQGKKALKFAVNSAQNRMARVAVPDSELTALTKELAAMGKMKPAKGGVASGLKLQTLDMVKRGFDDAINDAVSRSAPGTRSQEARDLESLRAAFLSELDNLDVTGKAGPNSLKPEGGAYARARKVYSGQPDKLAMRARAGNIADIDPANPKSVAPALMQGTQKTAQQAAEALGPEGSKAAGAAVIRNAIETNRGDPEALVRKLAPNDRTAEQLAAYLGVDNAQALDILNEVTNRVNMGNRLVKTPSPTQERTAAQNLMDGAAAAKDAATLNASGFIAKMAGMLGRQKDDPQFYNDLFRLMTTDEGMQLVREIADQQGTALQAIQNPSVPAVAAQTAASGLPMAGTATIPEAVGQLTVPHVTVRPSGTETQDQADERQRLINELKRQQLLDQLRQQ